jgi:hypothetical protein
VAAERVVSKACLVEVVRPHDQAPKDMSTNTHDTLTPEWRQHGARAEARSARPCTVAAARLGRATLPEGHPAVAGHGRGVVAAAKHAHRERQADGCRCVISTAEGRDWAALDVAAGG